MTLEKKKYNKKQWGEKVFRPIYKPKRGKLAPLMTEEEKKTANVQTLSYDFACRMVRLFQYLSEDAEYKEFIMSKQLYRAGTSIGANTREAQHAQSDADMLSKMNIAFKEADESSYWLSLLHDNGYLNDMQYESLNSDIVRLLKLLTTIVKTLRNKIGKQN